MAEASGTAPKLATLDYLVSSVLGSGSKGTVMLVSSRKVGGGQFALRVLKREGPEDDLAIERARAECEASTKLSHPAILKVWDFRLKRSWFRVSRAEMLMEYVDGKRLADLSGIPVAAGALIFQQIASALAHMHRRGVYHGDLTPARVLLSRKGQVKVRGYGISQVQEPMRPQIKPNAGYAAPERLKDKLVDDRTEVYGVGAVMYHVLTGRRPGDEVLGRTEGRKIAMPSAVNVQITSSLNNLLMSCLQSKPDRRPGDMYEVVTRIDAIVKEMGAQPSALTGLTAREQADGAPG
jgi:serine/threonine-protein kinase